MENTLNGVNVSVYRVNDLSDPAVKFKLEANCNQNHMTGIVLLCKNLNVVVVEGGPKQQKRFRRLMLNRIKWNELHSRMKSVDPENREKNRCALVWEGTVKTRSFGAIIFKMCPTVTFAREYFKKMSVEHYWDIAQTDAILKQADE
jgi:U4/U6 small nuclear ribonucleoprotein PRP3